MPKVSSGIPFTANQIGTDQINLETEDSSSLSVSRMLKHLLKEQNLPFITELTFEQIVEICKLKHIAEKYGKKNFKELNQKYPIEDTINDFVRNFCLFMTSHKRKRTIEFIDGLKAERENIERKPNFISRVLGR